jgi:hypothetical protein
VAYHVNSSEIAQEEVWGAIAETTARARIIVHSDLLFGKLIAQSGMVTNDG